MTDTYTVKMEFDADQAVSDIKRARNELHKADSSAEGMKKATKQMDGQFSNFSKTLSKLSPTLGRMAEAFAGVGASLKRNTAGMGQMSTAAASGAKGVAAAGATMTAALAPVAAIVIAIMVAFKAMQKQWQVMKDSFKAFDPTGYAKTFGALERQIKKIRTTLGYLSKGPVETIMKVLVGALGYLDDILMVFAEIKRWVDQVAEALGPVMDYLGKIIRLANPLFAMIGLFYDRGAEQLEEAADEITEATSIGLAGFDKLNSFSMETGDADRINELEELDIRSVDIGKNIKSALEDIYNMITGYFGGIGQLWKDLANGVVSWFGTVTGHIKNMWSIFTSLATAAITGFMNMASKAWGSFAGWAGGVWDSFKSAAEGVISTITDKIDQMLEPLREFYDKVMNNDIINGAKDTIDDVNDAAHGDTSALGRLAKQGAKNALQYSNPIGLAYTGIKSLFHAQGAVFAPNSPQVGIFGDNRKEPEVAAPYSMIVKAVQDAIRGAGGSGGAGERTIRIEVPVEIDGRQVARASYDYIENERIRRNRSAAI